MASQVGTHFHVTEAVALSPIAEDLLEKPGKYMFPQALDIVASCLEEEVHPDGFLFKVNPDLSFPPGDIFSIEIPAPGDRRQATFVMNFLGLHGAASPLPAYFTEHVAQHQDEADPVRDFLDIMNHLFVVLLYHIWQKYRYAILYEKGATDVISKRFFSFIGLEPDEMRNAKKIYWPKLMAYMGIINFSGESAGTLERIVQHYFNHPHVAIVPCIRRWVEIPSDQQTILSGEAVLGSGFILGTQSPDQTGKFRIRITKLTWGRFQEFLPLQEEFTILQTLVKFILKSNLDFDVQLELLPSEIHIWKLEAGSDCRLGWSAWAGDGGEGIVTLQTDHTEF